VYYVGRFLQVVGLGIGLLGCILGFDSATSERTMWTFCLVGVVVFAVGHYLIPKR
jgi:hypothetical protein